MNPFNLAGTLLILFGLALIARCAWRAFKPKRRYTILWGEDLRDKRG